MFPLLNTLINDRKVFTHWQYKGESTTDYHKRLHTSLEICAAAQLSLVEEALTVVLKDQFQSQAELRREPNKQPSHCNHMINTE